MEVGANQRLKINFMNVCLVIHFAINAIHSVLMALHAVFPLIRNAFRYGCWQRISLLFMQEDGAFQQSDDAVAERQCAGWTGGRRRLSVKAF